MVRVDELDDLQAGAELAGVGDDVHHLVSVLLLQEQIQLHDGDDVDRSLDAVLDFRDVAGLALGDGGDGGVGEVVQGDLDPVQRGGGKPVEVPGEGEPVCDQRGGVVAHLMLRQNLQDRAGQRGQQRLAAGEEDALDPGGGHGVDRGQEVASVESPAARLHRTVMVGDAWRDLALVVAEPAAELAAGGEGNAQLPAAAGEVAACPRGEVEAGRGRGRCHGHSWSPVRSSRPRSGRRF